MALIKCPECERPNVSDMADSCPGCGFGIKKYYENEAEKERIRKVQEEKTRIVEEKKEQIRIKAERKKEAREIKKSKLETLRRKNKNKLLIIGLLVISMFLICVLSIANIRINGKKTYRDAIKKYNLGDYTESEDMFLKLGNYRDSETYLNKTREKIAISLFEKEKYQEAEEKFQSIKNYIDNKEYIKQCKMQIAIELYNDKNYEIAKEKFIELAGYGESLQYFNKCKFYLAEELYNQKEYEEAHKNLVNLGEKEFIKISGKNSKAYNTMLNKCLKGVKEKAHKFFKKGNYKDALDAYDYYYIYNLEQKSDDIYMVEYRHDLCSAEYNFMKEYDRLKSNWYYYYYHDDYYQGYITISNDTIYVSNFRDIDVREGTYTYKIKTKSVKSSGKKYYRCYLYIPEIDMEIKHIIEYGDGDVNLLVSIDKENYWFRNDGNVENLEKPYIGMTKEQVESSSWGKPDHINKTTYAWGTREQWCYPNNQYIYFSDGVVTAIAE